MRLAAFYQRPSWKVLLNRCIQYTQSRCLFCVLCKTNHFKHEVSVVKIVFVDGVFVFFLLLLLFCVCVLFLFFYGGVVVVCGGFFLGGEGGCFVFQICLLSSYIVTPFYVWSYFQRKRGLQLLFSSVEYSHIVMLWWVVIVNNQHYRQALLSHAKSKNVSNSPCKCILQQIL